jgi:3-oxoacyl-[acyl-carrier-protein] synthase-3
MAIKIEMVSISRPWFRFLKGNSVSLTTRAASKCLRESNIYASDLGLLVNTGLYRHKNIGEPAIAALIQKKIGSNKTPKNNSGRSVNTFSFDLNNGGCGWLTGIQIVEGHMNTDNISYGMVVTGDSEPFYGLSEKFNFKSAAAALILSRSMDSKGFALFRSYSFPDHCDELTSSTDYNHSKWKGKKKNILYIRQKDTYMELCVNCATESLFNFLDELGLAIKEIDLIIPSQSPAGFTSEMKKRVGINGNLIEVTGTGDKMLHTAGPAFALKKVWDDKRFESSKQIIFLTVGSGITVSVALYVN